MTTGRGRSQRHPLRWVLALLLAAWAVAWPAAAWAKAKVEIGDVEIVGAAADKAKDTRLRRNIRRMAHHSAKHLDFGKSGKPVVSFVVKELRIEEQSGILRVTCTLVGKLKGGGTAKSRLSFGGKPDRRKQLERQVLTSVTDGVMTRLAEMARVKEKDDVKDKPKERPKGKG